MIENFSQTHSSNFKKSRQNSALSNFFSSSVISLKQSPVYRTKKPLRVVSDINDSEKCLVENLNHWENKNKFDSLQHIQQAKNELNRKLNHEDIVEENINKRKKNSLKSIGSGDIIKEKSKHLRIYEENLVFSLKNYEEKLKSVIEERDNARVKVSQVKDEIQEYRQSLEKCNSLLSTAIQNLKYNPKKKSEVAMYLSSKQNFKETISKQKIEVQQHIDILNIELSKISRELSDLDSLVSSLRSDKKVIENELLLHYSKLLKEGEDTRAEGLSWIVKNILNLGKDVKNEMFPSFLDNITIKVITNIARKSIELENFHNKLAECKSNKVENLNFKINIKERLQSLKKNIRIRKPEYSNKKLIWKESEILNADSSENENNFGIKFSNDTLKIEENINKIKSEIEELRNNEIKRLTRDCLKNGGNIKNFIGLIAGTESIDKYFIISKKEIKEVEAQKESTTTFSFTARVASKSISNQRLIF